MMQWKKHETIENLKEEFSDKINIAISFINNDEGIPFDAKSRIVKEIEFESSKYLNYILDPYLKNALIQTESLKSFDNKNKANIDLVKTNINEKIQNILYQKCVISYTDEEKPNKKVRQYIQNILTEINQTFNYVRTNVLAEKDEIRNGQGFKDKEQQEQTIANRLNFNKKAFLKTYLEEEIDGERIQRKYSLQRVTSDSNNSTKIMLSAIGNAIECGMKIKKVDLFDDGQFKRNQYLLLGVQKEEKIKNDIEGTKQNNSIQPNMQKMQDNDYRALLLKNRAVVATKKVLDDNGEEKTKNIVILSTDDQNLFADLELLHYFSKTQDPFQRKHLFRGSEVRSH